MIRRRIVIITGTPGVGKHTIAGRIAGWHTVDVNESARRAGTMSDFTPTMDVDTDALSHMLQKEITPPRDYLIVGHLAPYVIDKGDVVLAVVLRRDPYDLLNVYRQRGYADTKARENAGAELLGVISYDTFATSYARTFQIDTTAKSPDAAAAAISREISSACNDSQSRTCDDGSDIPRNSPVDWLEIYDKRAARGIAHPDILGDMLPGWPRRTHT